MLMIPFHNCQLSRHLKLASYQKHVVTYEYGQCTTKKQMRSKENFIYSVFLVVFNRIVLGQW